VDPISISVFSYGKDAELFKRVWNRGIDSRLEAFTKSKATFIADQVRIQLDVHPDEIQILLRRLLEEEDDRADDWVRIIIEDYWGISE